MKKIILLVSAVLGLTFTSMAQDNGQRHHAEHQPPTPEKYTQMLTHRCNLSEDQQAKVLDLAKQYSDAISPRAEKHDEFDAKLKEILTEEQAAKLHEHHGGPKGEGHPHNHGNHNGQMKEHSNNGNHNGQMKDKDKAKTNNGNAKGQTKDKEKKQK